MSDFFSVAINISRSKSSDSKVPSESAERRLKPKAEVAPDRVTNGQGEKNKKDSSCLGTSFSGDETPSRRLEVLTRSDANDPFEENIRESLPSFLKSFTKEARAEMEYAKLIHKKYKNDGNDWRLLSDEEELKIKLYESEHGIYSSEERTRIYQKYQVGIEMAEQNRVRIHPLEV